MHVIKILFCVIVLLFVELNVRAEVIPVQLAQTAHGAPGPDGIQFSDGTVTEVLIPYNNKDHWLKFTLSNPTDSKIEKMLFLDSPLSGKLTLFQEGRIGPILFSGAGRSLKDRASADRFGSFPISLEAHETGTFYLQRDSHHPLQTHLVWTDGKEFGESESTTKDIFFFYIGGIFCLVIYNILLGAYTRQVDYLLYAFFALSFCLAAMSLQGALDTYLFPNGFLVFSNYLMMFSSLSLLSASLFVERFLSIKKDFKAGYWGLRVVRLSATVTLVASFFASMHRDLFVFGYWIDFSIVVGVIFFIFCGVYSLVHYKNKLAYFFLMSWCVVFVGIAIWMMSVYGLIHANSFGKYSLLLANMGEMLILALGLAYKIKLLDTEKRVALEDAQDKERYHRLVRVLSHDVANTVSGVMFHSEMLKEHSIGPEAGSHVDKISTSISKLGTLLNSVRSEEVLHAFRSHTELEQVEVSEICREVVGHFNWELQEKEIQIKLSLQEPCYVHAQRSALANQVLANILSNAIKFSDVGKTIEVSCKGGDSAVVISIRDEGVGIPPEDLVHLFKGTRIISSKGTANESGSGIGTYLVSEYMKIFGGYIEVSSVHRRVSTASGTTVSLVFPLSART